MEYSLNQVYVQSSLQTLQNRHLRMNSIFELMLGYTLIIPRSFNWCFIATNMNNLENVRLGLQWRSSGATPKNTGKWIEIIH